MNFSDLFLWLKLLAIGSLILIGLMYLLNFLAVAYGNRYKNKLW